MSKTLVDYFNEELKITENFAAINNMLIISQIKMGIVAAECQVKQWNEIVEWAFGIKEGDVINISKLNELWKHDIEMDFEQPLEDIFYRIALLWRSEKSIEIAKEFQDEDE